MRKFTFLLLAAALALSAGAAFAADLTIESQVNLTAKDYANNFLTFKGGIATVEKDQVVPSADAATSASKKDSTELFNAYRFDAKGKKTLPGGIRGLWLYGVADDSTRTGDNLTVIKNANGSLTIRYVHRGTANEITTDANGKIALPAAVVKARVIGTTDNKIIHADFSSTGKVADVNWAKVWDGSIADGKQLGTTNAKTGKIVDDVANSEIYVWSGQVQTSFDGKILKTFSALEVLKK
jgi:hypothetical protein